MLIYDRKVRLRGVVKAILPKTTMQLWRGKLDNAKLLK